MIAAGPALTVRLAETPAEIVAAERLRYRIFVTELGGDGAMVDHAAGRERDRFDAVADHLLLIDAARPEEDRVVGLYRLLRSDAAARIGQFYTDDEYDLTPLRASGRRLLELGRSCLHPDYRGGSAMFHLWQGLADYVARHRIEVLFGTASFRGTDPAALAAPLSLLHHDYLAAPALRVRSRDAQSMDLVPADKIDRPAAIRAMPALIKAYLRLGGQVGEGAFVDRAFNTVDVCMVLDIERMTARQKTIYQGRGVA